MYVYFLGVVKVLWFYIKIKKGEKWKRIEKRFIFWFLVVKLDMILLIINIKFELYIEKFWCNIYNERKLVDDSVLLIIF